MLDNYTENSLVQFSGVPINIADKSLLVDKIDVNRPENNFL